jgi:hypothetical protein
MRAGRVSARVEAVRGRFRVATCEGYAINNPEARRSGTRQREGLSATVCDTLYNWREIATYRSEQYLRVPGMRNQTLGKVGALAAAQDHARYLNRLHRGD